MRALTQDEIDAVSGGNLLRDAYIALGSWIGARFGGAAGGAAGAFAGGAAYDIQEHTAYRGAAGGYGCAKTGDCSNLIKNK